MSMILVSNIDLASNSPSTENLREKTKTKHRTGHERQENLPGLIT